MKKLTTTLTAIALTAGLVACSEKKINDLPTNDEITTTINPMSDAAVPDSIAEPKAQLVSEAQKQPLTTLAISEVDFDFGDVKEGSVVEHKYEFTNTGSKPLIISTVKPGCGCTVPEFSKDPIMPKQKGFVTLKFESEGFRGQQQKYAEVFTNTEKTPVVLNFTANVTQ